MSNIQKEVLQEAYQYTQRLYNGIEEIIRLFKEEQVQQAYGMLLQVTDGMEWLVEVITLTQGVQQQPISPFVFKEVIVSIVEAMENKDDILLVETLRYEVSDVVIAVQEQIKCNIV